MTVPHRRATALTSLCVLALVAAGCRGGSDDGGGGGEDGELATDFGVTSEPCEAAVNEDNGCIYLGTLSDLTVGPFAALGGPITDGQAAFWAQVNEDGGIGGYDIDVETYVRDNEYNPEVTNQVYREIKPEILALAQSLGSPPTAAIIDDLGAESIVAAPAGWTSLYLFQDEIIESGATYCAEAMNGIDYAVEQYDPQTVLAVHYAGDFGADAAAGAKVGSDANGLEFSALETSAGTENQTAAVSRIVSEAPDVVVVAAGPADMATIVGGAVAQGYAGRFLGASPTWNPALLDSPAAPALEASFELMAPWGPWDTETDGHAAARDALADVAETPNDAYIFGWIWSYPLKDSIETAVDNGDLTRAGLVEALQSLESVDYEGVLPEGAGNFAGEGANEQAVRSTLISAVDPAATTGVSVVEEFFIGPTVEEYDFTGACYEEIDLG